MVTEPGVELYSLVVIQQQKNPHDDVENPSEDVFGLKGVCKQLDERVGK